jgi:shikimate dehydrogenase
MIDSGMAFDPALLPDGATVFDCVYVPRETPFLAAARARGLNAANGEEMLIAQAAIAFERWTGVGGMADVMREAVAPLFAQAGVTA